MRISVRRIFGFCSMPKFLLTHHKEISPWPAALTLSP